MRALAVLHSIHRSLITSQAPIPNIEFSFIATDLASPELSHPTRPIWALTRLPSEPFKWIMSDFGYWSWPVDLIGGYEDIRREIAATEPAFEEKERKVVWRGARKTNENRAHLLEISEGKSWADVSSIDWRDSSHVPEHEVNAMSVPEHCGYQFVIQSEGKLSFPLDTTGELITCRHQLLRSWKISPQLQLRCHHPQSNMDRTPAHSTRFFRPRSEFR
jgi:hypothetical protein